MTERKLQKEYNKRGILYTWPTNLETNSTTKARRQRLQTKIKFQNKCEEKYIPYTPPSVQEYTSTTK